MSERVEFEIPPGTNVGECRFCRALIAWVRPKDSIMPLDVNSARRVEVSPGRFRRYAESHFAHCPGAEQARKESPKALCRVPGCDTAIPKARHFCPACWARVPRSVRGLLRENASRFGKTHKRTLETLRHACQLSEQKRREEEDPAHGMLFDPGAATVEDPG